MSLSKRAAESIIKQGITHWHWSTVKGAIEAVAHADELREVLLDLLDGRKSTVEARKSARALLARIDAERGGGEGE
jgi:hypothetical protein